MYLILAWRQCFNGVFELRFQKEKLLTSSIVIRLGWGATILKVIYVPLIITILTVVLILEPYPAWRPPPWYSHLVITATLYWPEQKLSQSLSYLKNFFNTATPLIQLDFSGPLVTGLMGFHCTIQWFSLHLGRHRHCDRTQKFKTRSERP